MYNKDQNDGHGNTVSAECSMKTRELDTAVQLVPNVQWKPDSWTLQYS
jgi:3-deoxy-D-arabino-heptulosonate 7-phosphate (DAHP) synthase class II